MCGRFTLMLSPELLIELFGIAEFPSFSLAPRYNIAPTQDIPVVRRYADQRNRLDLVRWGLIPSWTKEGPTGAPLINARCETITEKPAFRQAIRYRRCLIPSSGFYEWRLEGKARLPLYIRLKDGAPMVFAGIWDSWKAPDGRSVDSCSILTTCANDLIAPIHERMPVILAPDQWQTWLDRDLRDPEKLKPFFRPLAADQIEMYPVSPQVNSARNEGADLVARCCV